MDSLRIDVRHDLEYSLKTFSPSENLCGGILSEYDVMKAHYFLSDYFLSEGEQVRFGILNYDMLASAVSRQYVSFGGYIKWQEVHEKLATLLYGLTKDHAFNDGNKRTALLSLLIGLHRNNRQVTCKKKDLEILLVRIASNELHLYHQFKTFQKGDDPEVRFIADYIRRHTRRIESKFYSLTYAEFNQKLKEYDVWLDHPQGNKINVYKKRKKTIKSILFSHSQDERILQIGFPGWKKQINLKAVKCVLQEAKLTPKEGIDSKSFFEGAEPEYKLIEEYHHVLKRLKDR